MSPDKTTDTQSVLDALVRGVTDRKPGPLTPIGQEASGPAYAGEAKEPFFGGEIAPMVAALHVIGDQLMMLMSIRDKLEANLTHMALEGRLPEHKTIPVAEPERLTEKQKVEAEPDFAARFAAQQAAAQAAVFTTTDAKAAASADSAVQGLWLCPVHGSATERTSKRGRKYRACEECSEFERA